MAHHDVAEARLGAAPDGLEELGPPRERGRAPGREVGVQHDLRGARQYIIITPN